MSAINLLGVIALITWAFSSLVIEGWRSRSHAPARPVDVQLAGLAAEFVFLSLAGYAVAL